MQEVNLKLVIAMARSYNKMFMRIEKNVKEYGLTISEFGVLEMLFHKGAQPVQQVAEKILVTSGTISYIVDKLEKRGLVIREKCRIDKRVYYVKLTQQGQQLIAEVFPKHKAFLGELLGGLEMDYKEDLIQKLIHLQNVL